MLFWSSCLEMQNSEVDECKKDSQVLSSLQAEGKAAERSSLGLIQPTVNCVINWFTTHNIIYHYISQILRKCTFVLHCKNQRSEFTPLHGMNFSLKENYVRAVTKLGKKLVQGQKKR